MADIIAATDSKRRGTSITKNTTKVDLTPLVDLGFLLITFFIFTTTMCQQTVLGLNLPHEGKPTNVKNTGALTVLLGANDNIFYYESSLLPNGSNFKACSFKDFRRKIIKKKKTTDQRFMYVIIKPSEESNYRNVVDMLDEMSINMIKSYSIDDATETEKQLVKISEK